ncbi:MAG: ribbon-helix-helix protein, CopG family [Patescibacteria group bacterium]
MNTIATNVRFPEDDYKELRLLAFAQGQSTASLIRQAVSFYKNRKMSTKLQISLAERLRKVSVKINIPVLELVREGRKFE